MWEKFYYIRVCIEFFAFDSLGCDSWKRVPQVSELNFAKQANNDIIESKYRKIEFSVSLIARFQTSQCDTEFLS